MIDQPSFRKKLAALEVELKAFEITQLRVVASASKQQMGEQDPASSILKLRGSEIEQGAAALLMDAAGPYALPELSDRVSAPSNNSPIGPDGVNRVPSIYFYSRAATIYSGSSEIQKNIIAKAILGL